jgi:hypothetical protein
MTLVSTLPDSKATRNRVRSTDDPPLAPSNVEEQKIPLFKLEVAEMKSTNQNGVMGAVTGIRQGSYCPSVRWDLG